MHLLLPCRSQRQINFKDSNEEDEDSSASRRVPGIAATTTFSECADRQSGDFNIIGRNTAIQQRGSKRRQWEVWEGRVALSFYTFGKS